jgi:hypothetical protein
MEAGEMDISCAFPPSLTIVQQVVLAERLGYRRAWVYDSPAFYGDVWVLLARAAERTTRATASRRPPRPVRPKSFMRRWVPTCRAS